MYVATALCVCLQHHVCGYSTTCVAAALRVLLEHYVCG
jgi:hypothetical protein